MRIRQPTSMPSVRHSDFSGVRSMLHVDSAHFIGHNSNILSSTVELDSSGRQLSPQFSNSEEHISPGLNVTNEDSNMAYLKPDYLDPLIATKCESVCTSPLALLAKTCQNIGQMMEIGKHVTKTTHCASATSRTTTSMPSGYINPILSGKISRPKGVNPVDLKSLKNGKRSFFGRCKWNRTDLDLLLPNTYLSSVGQLETATPTCTSVSTTTNMECIPTSDRLTGVAVVSLPNASSPSFSCPNTQLATSAINHTVSSSLSMFPTHSDKLNNGQATSNALAELARLSSSLSLPEPPRPVAGLLDGVMLKERFNWNDTSRVQTGTKRVRRNSGSVRCNASSTFPRKTSKDSRTSAFPPSELMSSYLNGTQSTVSPPISQSSASPPTATTQSAQNVLFNNSWPNMLHLIQQMAYHDTDLSRPTSQDTFSYHLARSFLEFFYRKMTGSQVTAASLTDPQSVDPPEYSVLREHLNTVFNSGTLTNSNLTTSKSFPEIDPMRTGAQLESLSSCCFLCGYRCSTQTELCVHVYAHLVTSEREQTMRRHPQPPLDTATPEWLSRESSIGYESSVSSALNVLTNHNFETYKTPDFSRLPVINSYLASVIAKQKDSCANDSFQTSVGDLFSPHTAPTSESVPDLNAHKALEQSLHSYWMKLVTSYCQNNHVMNTPNTVTQPPVPGPLSMASSNNIVWPHYMLPTFNSAASHLTLFPKV